MSKDRFPHQQPPPPPPSDRQTNRPAAGWSSLDDAELVWAARSGSSGALAALYDRFGERAYRVALAVCEDTRRAGDAVATAFGSIARTRSGAQRPSGVVAASLLVEVSRRATDLLPGTADAPHPLASLPPAEREAIVLARYGLLSAAEIAAELEVPVELVKTRLRAGLEMLRDAEMSGRS